MEAAANGAAASRGSGHALAGLAGAAREGREVFLDPLRVEPGVQPPGPLSEALQISNRWLQSGQRYS